jgi:hypothetical protein
MPGRGTEQSFSNGSMVLMTAGSPRSVFLSGTKRVDGDLAQSTLAPNPQTARGGAHMVRRILLLAVAGTMSLGFIVASAGSASAKGVVDWNFAPATASCTLSGGALIFKTPIGIVTPGGYAAPVRNKGNTITVAGVTLNCTSSLVPQGSFSGVLSGKIKTISVTDTPAQQYSCTDLTGVSPGPGGLMFGSLKIKWSAPGGVKFVQKKTVLQANSVLGGVNGASEGTFIIPGDPGNIINDFTIGGFPGNDVGVSSTLTDATAQTETTLASDCTSPAGLGTISLGTGTASLK